MNVFAPVLAAVLAYLVGSLSFAVIVSRAMGLHDPRSYGSGNPGATNVLRSGSKVAAVLTLLLDALKGLIPVLVVKTWGPQWGLGDGALALVALGAFVGHLFPVFFGFKGGKGVATALGVLLGISGWLGLIVLGLAWELWLAPLRPGGSWWVIKILPLLPALPGLLKNRMYTYRWLSLMVWLYVMEGAVRAWSDRAPSNWLALLEVLLCIVLFTACSLHVRLRLRAAREAAQAATPAVGPA